MECLAHVIVPHVRSLVKNFLRQREADIGLFAGVPVTCFFSPGAATFVLSILELDAGYIGGGSVVLLVVFVVVLQLVMIIC